MAEAKKRRRRKKIAKSLAAEGPIPIDPSTAPFLITGVEAADFYESLSEVHGVHHKPEDKSWYVLTAEETSRLFPLNASAVRKYYARLRELQRSGDLMHLVFLNQSYTTPFYGLLDTGSRRNVIHPACVAMMMAEAPWAVRVVKHQRVESEGIAEGVIVANDMTCILRINHHGRPHLVEFSVIENASTMLMLGLNFMEKFGVEIHTRPSTRISTGDVRSLTVLPYKLKEALDFKTISVDTRTVNDDTISLWAGASEWPSASLRQLEELVNDSASTCELLTMKSGLTYSDIVAASNRVNKQVENIRTFMDTAPKDYEMFTIMGFIQRENLINYFPKHVQNNVRLTLYPFQRLILKNQ